MVNGETRMLLKSKIDRRIHREKIARMAIASSKGSGDLVMEARRSRRQTMEHNLVMVSEAIVGNTTK